MQKSENKIQTALTEDTIQQELNRKATRKEQITNFLPYVGIILLIVFFTIMTTGKFISLENLKLLLNQSFTMVIVAVGAAFLYSIGALDMAIGSVMAMSALITTVLYNAQVPLLLSLLAGILISILAMSITAFANVYLSISSFIASLCVMNISNGVVLAHRAAMGNTSFPYSQAPWLDKPVTKLIVLIVLILAGYILFNYTHFGKSLKAMGGNQRVARISGIRTGLMTFMAYAVMGLVIGIAALFAVVRGGIADTSIGAGMNLNIMTAVVLGGFPLHGGANARFSAPIIGALMVTVLSNGLSLMGQANAVGYAVKGILFIVVVALTYEKSNGKLIN